MRIIRFLIVFVCFCCCPDLFAGTKPVKVACVGNSITYGAFIQNPELNSFPAQLGAYLGEGYEVKNFGVSGATLLKHGDYPYMATDVYRQSLSYKPDIVFIKLGTNDSKPQNRCSLEQFKHDYLELIDSYKKLSSHPRIILLTPVRCFLTGNESISDSVIQTGVTPLIKEIAGEKNLELVNLYYLFGDTWTDYMMPDRLHPSSIGAGRIAEKLYDYLRVPVSGNVDIISRFPLKPVRQFNFHGYKGYAYVHDGTEYYIVEPHRPAAGAPWIWRARFWGHEPQTDISMLENGFYLTYCDVVDLYGSEKAVGRWNTFYDLAQKAGLAQKAVLEGMSRGGLIVYNWAAANPDKVACIYADAPVMDIKSWPVGKGLSDGSSEDTERMLKAYGFRTKDEVLAWQNNPIDHAEVLARAAIPMIHVVGDADDVVPVSENTAVFAKRLKTQGYALEVIHKPGGGHHPHSLNNPKPIVDYILKATGRAENMCIHPICGNEYRSAAGWCEGADWQAVSQEISAVLDGKELKLLMLGNSITQGFGGNRQKVTYKPGKEAMDEAVGKDCWESAGISGDCTQQLLWRLRYGHYGKCRPENVILTIGINNVTRGDTPQDIVDGIKACVSEARLQFPDARIILFGLLPAGKEIDSPNRIVCNRIHELLSRSQMAEVEYINPTSWFVHENGGLKTELYGNDYLHLNANGYNTWCGKIKGIISK